MNRRHAAAKPNPALAAPEIPDGLAIPGPDDALGRCFMLYFDEGGVSRQYEVTLGRNGLEWSRDDPKFAQRFSITVAKGGNTLAGRGEMSREGSPWEPDLELTYTRE